MTIDQPVEDAAGLCDDLVPPLLLLPVLPKHPHKGSCTPQTPPTISRPFRDFDDQIGCWKELIKYPKNENSWFFGWTIFSNLLVCVCVVYHHVAFHVLKSLSKYLTCDRLVVLVLFLVIFQSTWVSKCFSTFLTAMRFLTGMLARVNL